MEPNPQSLILSATVQIISQYSSIARPHQPQSLAARELVTFACLRQTQVPRFQYSNTPIFHYFIASSFHPGSHSKSSNHNSFYCVHPVFRFIENYTILRFKNFIGHFHSVKPELHEYLLAYLCFPVMK